MSAARDTNRCVELDRWLTAYVDDELDAVHILDVEEHLEQCEVCREQVALIQATRRSLRRVACVTASEELRQRICAAMVAERHSEQEQAALLPAIHRAEDDVAASDERSSDAPTSRDATRADEPRLLQLRYVVPLAAAATLALVIGAVHGNPESTADVRGGTTPVTTAATVSPNTFDHFLDELVAAHAQPPPPEVTSFDNLGRFDPYVGVRIPRPQLATAGATFKGARMHSRAAMLQYMLRQRHRVTVYVFDPARVPLRANRLSQRRYGARDVYVGHVRGYAVAASERQGVGWAIASDLSNDESAQLLLMAAR